MILAQKQTHRSIEHNRKPRNKPTFMWAISLIKGGKNIQWKKTVSSINGVEKTGQLHAKESN